MKQPKILNKYGRALKNRNRFKMFSRKWKKWDRVALRLILSMGRLPGVKLFINDVQVN